jgi:hypothetical protein
MLLYAFYAMHLAVTVENPLVAKGAAMLQLSTAAMLRKRRTLSRLATENR